jgi:ribosomal protein S17E
MNSLTYCFALIILLFALAVGPVASGQATPSPQSAHSAEAHDQPQASVSAGARIQPLRAGFDFPRQTLRYEAEYRFWTAGVATLRVERNGSQEHLSGTADSTGVVAMLFRVQDRFNSYFDAQNLCSQKLVKHTEEGSHWRDTTITYDYKRSKAVLEEKNLKNGQSKRTENDIPGCVTDVVSGILYVASLPLQPDASYSLPLNDGGKTVTIQAHVEGKEQIKTPAGTFQTIRVGPQGDYSVLKNRGRILIWYSDDARHLPIQIQARMFWGTLTVYLASVDK